MGCDDKLQFWGITFNELSYVDGEINKVILIKWAYRVIYKDVLIVAKIRRFTIGCVSILYNEIEEMVKDTPDKTTLLPLWYFNSGDCLSITGCIRELYTVKTFKLSS